MTGDGIVTALMLLSRMAETGRTLADLASVISRLPQVLISIRVADNRKLSRSADVAAAIAEVEAELGETGRVLVRPSGTEPLVRVLVEANSGAVAATSAERIAEAVRGSLRY